MRYTGIARRCFADRSLGAARFAKSALTAKLVNPREIKYFALKGAKSVFAGPLPDGVAKPDST
jgi:hypothetical protein